VNIKITAVVKDARSGVNEVTLYYRKVGDSRFVSAVMSQTGTNAYTVDIPAEYVTSVGVQYYIEAKDSTKNVVYAPLTAPTTPYSITVVVTDVTPPVITHTAVTQGYDGVALGVSANITDSIGVASVTLYYKKVGAVKFTTVAMGLVSGNIYSATIPAASVTIDGVEYYIVAFDTSGNSARSPPSGASAITVSAHAVTDSTDTCTFNLKDLENILRERKLQDQSIRSIINGYPEEWNCRRKRYKDGERCIFHAEIKDCLDFKTEFQKELQKMENEGDKFDFTGFIFPQVVFGKVDSISKVFGKPVTLVGATFKERAEFGETTFKETVNFTGSMFRDVNFTKAVFQEAYFSNAIFKEKAYFSEAVFKEGTYFVEATFKESAYFSMVTFQDANFSKATFQNAHFTKARFKEAYFRESVFLGGAFFRDCRFDVVADFSYACFDEQVFLRRSNDNGKQATFVLIFPFTIFKKPRLVQIQDYPLSKVSLIGTDVLDVLLIPTREKEERILDEILLAESEKKGNAITQDYEPIMAIHEVSPKKDPMEIAMRSLSPYLSFRGLIAEYRVVRKCLETNRMFTEAANLFVREMKLARRDLSWRRDLFEKVAHYLYELISRYGESINRPILLSLASIILMANILFLSNLGFTIDYLSYLPRYLEAVSSVFMQIRSFKDFDFLENMPFILSWEMVTRVTSITFIGNLFIAIKRRLERR
jgi:uncharacterized protein YjbI with pentapeptide repeats